MSYRARGYHRGAYRGHSSWSTEYEGTQNSAAPSTGFISDSSDVSYDTNCMTPEAKRCRIFLGNLGTMPVTREAVIDLCRQFGTVVAASLFKGFAFVQFAEYTAADEAVFNLNNTTFNGSRIEVRLAINPAGIQEANEANLQKLKSQEKEYIEDIEKVHAKNRKFAMEDNTKNSDLFDTTMSDTLICGACRFVTCDLEAYKNHRMTGCAKPKNIAEPALMKCASCGQKFETAWALLLHLTEFHRMNLFSPEEPASLKNENQ